MVLSLASSFQSTLPARGATIPLRHPGQARKISIHAPREGSDIILHEGRPKPRNISIHAPREGSDDTRPPATNGTFCNFNPRSPRGERPGTLHIEPYDIGHFNPRSPRGERHSHFFPPTQTSNFNPRSPRGERLRKYRYYLRRIDISIHAPREGSDF